MSLLRTEVELGIGAKIAWEVLADFKNIHAYAPGIKASPLLSEEENGVGACRRCDFSMGGMAMTETITEWVEGKGYTIELSEFPMPFHRATLTFVVTPLDDQRCTVKTVLNYDMKYGFLGSIMNVVMVRPMMGIQFKKLIRGIETFARDNQLVMAAG